MSSLDVTTEAVWKLHEGGLSERKIAVELGTTRSMVRRRLSEHRDSRGRRVVDASRLVGSTKEVWSKATNSLSTLSGFSHYNEENDLSLANFGLDGDSWSQFGSRLTLPALSTLSPSINRALWDYLRLLDPGHELKVYRLGTTEIDDDAQELIERFIQDRIDPYYSSLKGLIQQLNMGVLYRGALCTQLLLDDTGTTPYGVLAPDPELIVFRSKEDTYMGRVWEPGVEINGEWTSVKSPYFHYVPFDPQPGDPYGRSIIGSSAFPSMFLLGLLHDLRRVVAQQGYPKKDITILTSKLRDTFETKNDDEFKKIVEDFIGEVSRQYGGLEPDDAFIHTDAVTVGRSEGAVDSNVIGGSKSLLDMLERLEVRALKTMPIMMGLPSSASESDANRQWEIFVQGIKHMQHFGENVLESLFTDVLRLRGRQGVVEFKFAEIRSAEILRDEQTKSALYGNLITARKEGWISNDEAAEAAVGHKAVADPIDDVADEEVSGLQDMSEPMDDGGPEDVGPEGYSVKKQSRLAGSITSFHQRATGQALILGSALHVDSAVLENAKAAWRRVFRSKIEELMLDAVPIGTAEEAKGRDDSRWFWDMENREFVTAYGARRDATAVRELLKKFRRALEREVNAGSPSAAIGSHDSAAWEAVRDALLVGAIAGHGGTDNMGAAYNAELADAVREQFDYWQKFQEDMALLEEEEQQEQSRRRWPLYLAVGMTLYFASRSDEWNIRIDFVPPLHPNCDCFLEYGEDADGPWVTWQTVDPNCPDCDTLAETYVKYRGSS